jgi:hypothetical protein
VYRVLEHIPLELLDSLWLITAHGLSLEIRPAELPEENYDGYHLYQEICPIRSLIVTKMDPERFRALVTEPSRSIRVPRICFTELRLSGLAQDPAKGYAGDLPYRYIDILRDSLIDLDEYPDKPARTVDRIWKRTIQFSCMDNGIFVGDRRRMLYYPLPSYRELQYEYYAWWRCVNDSEVDEPVAWA